MYVNVVFVIRCLYSAVSLTLVKEKRFIRIIIYYYYCREPRSQEVGEEGDYTYRYTVTTRMTPALRQAAMRASLMFY